MIPFLLSCFPQIFLVSDFFHPIDHFAVERFLNGDMRHRGRWRSAVPMLFVRRKPDYITRPDLLNRSAFALRASKSGGDDQRLTKWMRMPGGASTRLERDACGTHPCRFRRLEQRINPYRAGEPISRAFCRRSRSNSYYLHFSNVVVSSPALNFSTAQHSQQRLIYCGRSLPACSPTMYFAYQSQFASRCPVRFSCSPWAASARRNALARSLAEANVAAGSSRSRVVISWSSQAFPSGSLNETNE
jgi:hypothetical protein